MKPYVICHMVASIDGRIDCSMVDKISGEEYYTALEQLDCPSLLEGRVTMEHYNAAKGLFVPYMWLRSLMPTWYRSILRDTCVGTQTALMMCRLSASSVRKSPGNIWRCCTNRKYHGLLLGKKILI